MWVLQLLGWVEEYSPVAWHYHWLHALWQAACSADMLLLQPWTNKPTPAFHVCCVFLARHVVQKCKDMCGLLESVINTSSV
jgi:hypothetical protein